VSDSAKLARRWPTATLLEAGGHHPLPPRIAPLLTSMRLAAPALTVSCSPRDNLWIHNALYHPRARGSVLVVAVGEAREHGYWGEILSTAAARAGLLGLVIDGCVRDRDALVEIGFPVFCTGLCIRGTTKDPAAPGWIGGPLRIGDTRVRTGDYVFGDADGVVIVPAAALDQTLATAEQRELTELTVLDRLAAGERTLDIYDLPDLLGGTES
jgi:4-hydroxy-4-methyl-2-oxoglutarate aldolase